MDKYKILSLDGGGSWALVQAMALKRIFGDLPGREILAQFDLVISNSGGSIIAAGLAENYKPSELEEFFLNESTRKSIFANLRKKSFISRLLRLMRIGPKYSSEEKYFGLLKVLPKLSEIPLTEVPNLILGARDTHFMIAAFEYHSNQAIFFRSNLRSASKAANLVNRREKNIPKYNSPVTFVQAVHASTNAPVNYFDEPAKLAYETLRGTILRYYWDGAIGGYNNPILGGITEALSNGIDSKKIHVLSIGTGKKKLPKKDVFQSRIEDFVVQFSRPSFSKDVVKLASSIMYIEDAANYTAYVFTHPDLPEKSSRFVRLCPLIQSSLKLVDNIPTWDVPDGYSLSEFRDLMDLEMDAIEQEHVLLIQKMTQLWLDDQTLNQPIRYDKFLRCLLGHNTFGEALDDLERWLVSCLRPKTRKHT